MPTQHEDFLARGKAPPADSGIAAPITRGEHTREAFLARGAAAQVSAAEPEAEQRDTITLFEDSTDD